MHNFANGTWVERMATSNVAQNTLEATIGTTITPSAFSNAAELGANATDAGIQSSSDLSR